MLIEDYAFIGDTHGAALVSVDGSVDWLCMPRFDSGSCFGALLDHRRGGHWRIAPESGDFTASRRYREDSMVLETTFTTDDGVVTLVDCLPVNEMNPKDPRSLLTNEAMVRRVVGVEGNVRMAMEWRPRFDYGEVTPWLRSCDDFIEAVGGPDALDLQATVPLEVADHAVSASFSVTPNEPASFMTRYSLSHLEPASLDLRADGERLIEETDAFWREWASRCTYRGRWQKEVSRSLMVLKALTFSPTGGVVAAPTTSLPENIGGARNWDYRYCWLRDTTFTLEVLLEHGFVDEATEWRDWLLRAVAGDPDDLQIMYGVFGERRLTEVELPWLDGYEGSRPVREGNAATKQFQLDVYGEVMDALHSAARAGVAPSDDAWALQREIVDFVCAHWTRPDNGIWEVRSGQRHFTHSKVMAWVAVDRGISMIENFDREGPAEHWRAVRSEIREEVLTRGYDEGLGYFKRSYDDQTLDAALLVLPLIGFIEAGDERMVRTIEAINERLTVDGFVRRYETKDSSDGLPGSEGVFLMCSFWLVNCLELIGRHDQAVQLFERLLSLRNDLGLLSEEYDGARGRLVGNFPQAFSHVALATSALALEHEGRLAALQRGHPQRRRLR